MKTLNLPLGRQLRSQGFTFAELLALLLTLVVVVLVVLPMLRPRQINSARIRCVNNLRSVALSARLWASDHDEAFPWQVSTNLGGVREPAWRGDIVAIYRVLSNEIANPRILICRSDTSRVPAADFESLLVSNLSYFSSIHADGSNEFLLAGDRNLLINGRRGGAGVVAVSTNYDVAWDRDVHRRAGNIALSDGSVQQLTSGGLPGVIHRASPSTNLLVFP